MTMDAVEYTERFGLIEERLGLFDDIANGIPWWDPVRYEIHTAVYQRLVGARYPTPASPSLFVRAGRLLARLALRAWLWTRILVGRHDVLVFRAARKVRNGRRLDAAIDQLAQACPGRKLVIDTFPYYYHRSARNGNPRLVDRPPMLDRLAQELRAQFSVDLAARDLEDVALPLLAAHLRALRDYRRLLRAVRPKLVVMTQNGIEKALFRAARELGVVVVEGQHGLIGLGHPAYSYPRQVDKRSLVGFPNCFIAFSDYWIRSCRYPADRCIALGNDEFHVIPPAPPRNGDVLFVSADIYHATLGAWLKQVARMMPHRTFAYKLHPNQRDDFSAIAADLASWSNVKVVNGDVPMGEVLPAASVVVLIQSTAAYEALQSGRRLCIVPELNYHLHRDLFELPGVHVPSDVSTLARAIEAPSGDGAPASFFDRFDDAAARRLFGELMGIPAAPGKAPADTRVHSSCEEQAR